MFCLAGLAVFVSYAISEMSGSTAGVPLAVVFFPVGLLILGVGLYYLWRFDIVHKRELRRQVGQPVAK